MEIRIATINDIDQIFYVRNTVTENKLTNPSSVTPEICIDYITQRGKGWVAVIGDQIWGFSIVDLLENNIWALFVHPNFQGKGIGKKLHDIMLSWYFTQTNDTLWLSTDPQTKAESFYRKSGWKEKGICKNNEIRFEMTKSSWSPK